MSAASEDPCLHVRLRCFRTPSVSPDTGRRPSLPRGRPRAPRPAPEQVSGVRSRRPGSVGPPGPARPHLPLRASSPSRRGAAVQAAPAEVARAFPSLGPWGLHGPPAPCHAGQGTVHTRLGPFPDRASLGQAPTSARVPYLWVSRSPHRAGMECCCAEVTRGREGHGGTVLMATGGDGSFGRGGLGPRDPHPQVHSWWPQSWCDGDSGSSVPCIFFSRPGWPGEVGVPRRSLDLVSWCHSLPHTPCTPMALLRSRVLTPATSHRPESCCHGLPLDLRTACAMLSCFLCLFHEDVSPSRTLTFFLSPADRSPDPVSAPQATLGSVPSPQPHC